MTRHNTYMNHTVWPWFFCGTVFVCLQFPHHGNDMIFWIFPIVPCHAFCILHWPIDKDLDLNFIWGHYHLHLVGMVDRSVDQLITSLLASPCSRDSTRSKQLSKVAILGFQCGLYHVVVPLSFLQHINHCKLKSSCREIHGEKLEQVLSTIQVRVWLKKNSCTSYCPPKIHGQPKGKKKFRSQKLSQPHLNKYCFVPDNFDAFSL